MSTGYHNPAPVVNPTPEISSGRPGTRESLGLLVLFLSARTPDLRASETCRGWPLAERWLSEIVEARLAGGTAR